MTNLSSTSEIKRGKQTILTTKAWDLMAVNTIYVGDGSIHNYESLVFRFSILKDEIEDTNEYDSQIYKTLREANIGHDLLVTKWENEERDITTIKHYYD